MAIESNATYLCRAYSRERIQNNVPLIAAGFNKSAYKF